MVTVPMKRVLMPIFLYSFVFIFLCFSGKALADTYYASGTVTSSNILYDQWVGIISAFGYYATSIPAGTTAKIQFSQDGSTWVNSSGTADGWDGLSEGNFLAEGDAIDLSGLSWAGPHLYYQIQFDTSDTSATPVLEGVNVIFTPSDILFSGSTTYPLTGTVTSSNILASQWVATINKFGYNASLIPAGTSIKIQFSQDGANWVNSSGQAGQWDTLSQGDHTAEVDSVDLAGLSWTGPNLYYQVQMDTNDTSITPVLDGVIVHYTESVLFSDTTTYTTSGSLTSSNLLDGETAGTINGFTYTLSSLPAGTSATVQYSQDGSNWYNSAGASGGNDSLSSGANTIPLTSLGWTGANFYYKVTFTSDGANTPVLDSVSVSVDDVAPASLSSLSQLKDDDLTMITNGSDTDEDKIRLHVSATDADNPDTITLFFELRENSDSYTSAAIPTVSGSCASGTSFGMCASKVWYSTSTEGDYSSTPYAGSAYVTGLTNKIDYKWQVKACDALSACSAWVPFNATTPNFGVLLPEPVILRGGVKIRGGTVLK